MLLLFHIAQSYTYMSLAAAAGCEECIAQINMCDDGAWRSQCFELRPQRDMDPR